jgi:hypothetical protein
MASTSLSLAAVHAGRLPRSRLGFHAPLRMRIKSCQLAPFSPIYLLRTRIRMTFRAPQTLQTKYLSINELSPCTTSSCTVSTPSPRSGHLTTADESSIRILAASIQPCASDLVIKTRQNHAPAKRPSSVCSGCRRGARGRLTGHYSNCRRSSEDGAAANITFVTLIASCWRAWRSADIR